MLELSKEKSRVASENADFKAFSEAQVDIKNYEECGTIIIGLLRKRLLNQLTNDNNCGYIKLKSI